jgi:hypothetical protein
MPRRKGFGEPEVGGSDADRLGRNNLAAVVIFVPIATLVISSEATFLFDEIIYYC